MNNINKKRIGSYFLIKVLTFIILFFFLDFVIGNFLSHLYLKQKSGLLYRSTYAIDSTKADILIFGASRANHHYVPSFFESRLKESCYNTGRDGETILFNYAVLKCILKRYSPKMAILDMSREEFMQVPENYDRLSALLPYYKTHPEIQSIANLRGPYEKYKMLLNTYPYNSLVYTIAIGVTEYNESRDYIKDEDGYVPLPEVWKEPLKVDTAIAEYNLDSNTIKAYESFIRDCTQSGIKVYIIFSPVFKKYLTEDKSVQIAKRIAKQFNVPLYDFTSDSLFLNSTGLFTDADHLNEKGAVLLTNKVIDKILQKEKQGYRKSEQNLLHRN